MTRSPIELLWTAKNNVKEIFWDKIHTVATVLQLLSKVNVIKQPGHAGHHPQLQASHHLRNWLCQGQDSVKKAM